MPMLQLALQDCYEGTSRVVAEDPYALEVMPLHLACAVELGQKNELFLRSHRSVPPMAVGSHRF